MTSRRLTISILTAAALWFLMFSPWTSGAVNFWLEMSVAACILTALALKDTKSTKDTGTDTGTGTKGTIIKDLKCEKPLLQILLGVVIAFALWGIFWIGDFLASRMFDFARNQVNDVYAMKQGLPGPIIALLLLLVIGPAEELFWRGFVQKQMELQISHWRFPKDHAFLITTLVYALVHIWSLNFMLVMAALVAGAVWGFIYRLQPKLLPALIVSHALWDALVFVILPI